MHTLFFALKRVHLMALELSRAMLGTALLTPARFDMLRIVHVNDLDGAGVPQSNIRLLLGVSAATISRMLKALEARGLIVRERLARDARCLVIHLSGLGRVIMDAAMALLIDSGVIDSQLDEIAHPFPERVDALGELLTFFRDGLEDPAPFPHPWRRGQLDVGWPARFFLPTTHWALTGRRER